jgi:hypothetical protein
VNAGISQRNKHGSDREQINLNRRNRTLPQMALSPNDCSKVNERQLGQIILTVDVNCVSNANTEITTEPNPTDSKRINPEKTLKFVFLRRKQANPGRFRRPATAINKSRL